MYDKEYEIDHLYVGILTRQNRSALSITSGIKLWNLKACIFIKEGHLYRHLLSDGIYATTETASHHNVAINAPTLIPLIEAEPKLAQLKTIKRSHLIELEEILQTTYFTKFEREGTIYPIAQKHKEI